LSRCDQPIVVVKIGGSILTDAKAYRRAGMFVRDRLHAASGERYVVVVSAQDGTTDKLERTAQRIEPSPTRRALDLLWATGELRSVAILTMHLDTLGVPAVGLNVHETGLMVPESGCSYDDVTVNSDVLEKELGRHRVVVVPGFLATNAAGSIVSLGRGGSDLTAVLLATGLDAARCELLKDVAGYFTSDPRADRSAQHIRSLTYKQALEMADDGCALVQREAIEAALSVSLPMLIRSMDEANLATVISSTLSDQDLKPTASELSVPD
jgi:aspartate kinase